MGPPVGSSPGPGCAPGASETVDKPLSPRSGDEARPAQGRDPWLLKGTQRPVGCRIICQVQRAPQAPEEDVRNWPNQPRVRVHLPPAARRSAQTGPPSAGGLLPSCQSPHLGPPTASSPVCPDSSWVLASLLCWADSFSPSETKLQLPASSRKPSLIPHQAGP